MFIALLIIVAVKYVLALGAMAAALLRPSATTTAATVAASVWSVASVLTMLAALYYAYQWVVLDGDLKPLTVMGALVVVDTIGGGGVKVNSS